MNTKRKGFMHSIDAVLAGILLLTFIGFIFPSPVKINWETVHLEKEGTTFIDSLDRINYLGKLSLRSDQDSFRTLVNSISQNKEIIIRSLNLPPSNIELAYLIDDSSTFMFNLSYGNYNGTDLPASENQIYRNGNMFGVNFVLSDTIEDGLERYNFVNFDFNNNNDYNDLGEGPFQFNSVFLCKKTFTPVSNDCNGKLYEIGPIFEQLIILDATDAQNLDKKLGEVIFENSTISFEMDTVNLNFEGVIEKDIVIIDEKVNGNSYLEKLTAFLNNGNSILELKNSVGDFEEFLGFEEKAIVGNIFDDAVFSTEEFSKKYYPEILFSNLEIEIQNYTEDFRDPDENNTLIYSGWNITNISGEKFYTSKLNLRNTNWNVLMNSDNKTVLFSQNNNFFDKKEWKSGEVVNLSDNNFEIPSTFPLRLIPLESYNFSLKKINGFSISVLDFKNNFYSDNSKAYAVLYSEKIVNGKGQSILLGQQDFGDDSFSLLKSLIIFLSMKENSIVSGSVGGNSVGINYLGLIGKENKIPFGLEFIWWFT